jgi:hypothetical protein
LLARRADFERTGSLPQGLCVFTQPLWSRMSNSND